jgi:hypothetical protein
VQNRYAGDVGDYVKLALLRAVSPEYSLGVAWYLYPDEGHNADGRHISYLDHPQKWRHLDPDLFDALGSIARSERSVAALERTGVLGSATFAGEEITTADLKAHERAAERAKWFQRVQSSLSHCDLVFADPDNGLIDDGPHRVRQRKFGKQLPLSEALSLSHGRTAIIYHHNTRYPGGHDLEVRSWRSQLGRDTIAVRANAFSCRTFFVLNPSPQVAKHVSQFCRAWSGHGVRLDV